MAMVIPEEIVSILRELKQNAREYGIEVTVVSVMTTEEYLRRLEAYINDEGEKIVE
jgi:hypothetical protein